MEKFSVFRYRGAKSGLAAKRFMQKRGCFEGHILTNCAKLFLIMSFFFMPSVVLGQRAQKTNVLIVNSYHKEFPWTDAQTAAVREVLTGAIDDLELYIEYMDTKRVYSEEYLEHWANILDLKYSSLRFDVIITTDDNALGFVMKHHQNIFNGSPVSFCGVNYFDRYVFEDQDMFTGLVEVLDIKPTIDMALKLHPGIHNVFVIVDNTPTGMGQRKDVAAVEKHYPNLKFEYLKGEDYSNAELLGKLSTLPKDSIVLLTVWLRDKNGQYISVDKGGPLLSSAATVPVYGIINMYLGHGIVGGKLLDSSRQGAVAGELALRILKGEKPSSIPIIIESTNPYMFDYNQLRRWGISNSNLPKDSVIINQPLPIVEEKRKLVVALFFIAIEGMIILLLIINLIKRRTGRQLFANLEYRVISLAITFGLIVLVFDAVIDYLFFFTEKTFWSSLVDIPPHEIYMRLLVLISFTLFGIVLSVVLVKRRQAERILKLRNTAISNSPNGVIIADHIDTNDNPILYVNPSFEKITGYRFDEVKGRDLRVLQGDDQDQSGLNEVRLAIKDHRSCQVTIRNRRKDGTMFYNELKIVPSLDEDGEVTHYIGIINDISERKLAGEKINQQLDELQRWHDVMLGREDRNRELKREVNELLKHLDKPVRYPSEANPK